jgi:hypothetical protein
MSARQEKLSRTLETLDATKGGIPETGEVKNKDKLLVYWPGKSMPYVFLCMVWDFTLELIGGKIRTLTITRKDV